MQVIDIGSHIAIRRDYLYCGYTISVYYVAPTKAIRYTPPVNVPVYRTSTVNGCSIPMPVPTTRYSLPDAPILYDLDNILQVLCELDPDGTAVYNDPKPRNALKESPSTLRHGSSVYITPTALNEHLTRLTLVLDSDQYVSSILSFLGLQVQKLRKWYAFGSIHMDTTTIAGITTPEQYEDSCSAYTNNVQILGPVHSVPSSPVQSTITSSLQVTKNAQSSGSSKKRGRPRSKQSAVPSTSADQPQPQNTALDHQTTEILVEDAADHDIIARALKPQIHVNSEPGDHEITVFDGSIAPHDLPPLPSEHIDMFRQIMTPYSQSSSVDYGGGGSEQAFRKFASWCVFLKSTNHIDMDLCKDLMSWYMDIVLNPDPTPNTSTIVPDPPAKKRKTTTSTSTSVTRTTK